jgi:hypothetical protein
MGWKFDRASEFHLTKARTADQDRASLIPSLAREYEVISGRCNCHFVKVASAGHEQTEVKFKTENTPRYICLHYYRKTVR